MGSLRHVERFIQQFGDVKRSIIGKSQDHVLSVRSRKMELILGQTARKCIVQVGLAQNKQSVFFLEISRFVGKQEFIIPDYAHHAPLSVIRPAPQTMIFISTP